MTIFSNVWGSEREKMLQKGGVRLQDFRRAHNGFR